MTDFAGSPRPIVIKTSRETLSLAVAASAIAVALSFTVHAKREAASPQPMRMTGDASPTMPDWTGRLSDVAAVVPAPSPAEPMTSASLTVPKAQFALPTPSKAKPKPCADSPCATAKATVQAPPTVSAQPALRREVASALKPPAKGDTRKSLASYLNPMNHLPDMSVVSRPFVYAGGAVSGWFKRL